MQLLILATPDMAYESGSSLFVRGASEALASRGCDVHVVCDRPPKMRRSPDRVTYHTVRMPLDYQVPLDRPVRTPDLLETVGAYIQGAAACFPDNAGHDQVDREVAVVSIYGTLTAAAGQVVSTVLGCPHVVVTFGRDVSVARHRDLRLGRLLHETMPTADAVVASSRALHDEIVRGGLADGDAVLTVEPGLDLAGFGSWRKAAARRSVGWSEDDVVAIAVQSSFNRDKGLDLVLEAIPWIKGAGGRLVVVGGDDSPEQENRLRLERIVNKHGAWSHVEFLGFQPHERIPALLAASDVFVDPRSSQDFSTSMLEALASGVATVVRSNSGCADLLMGTNTAVIAPGNSREFGQAVAGIIAAPELRGEIAARGVEWFDRHRSRFDYSRVASDLLRVLDLAATKASRRFESVPRVVPPARGVE